MFRVLQLRNGLIAVGNCNIRRLAKNCASIVQQAVASNGGNLMPNPYLIASCFHTTEAWKWPHAIDAFGKLAK